MHQKVVKTATIASYFVSRARSESARMNGAEGKLKEKRREDCKTREYKTAVERSIAGCNKSSRGSMPPFDSQGSSLWWTSVKP